MGNAIGAERLAQALDHLAGIVQRLVRCDKSLVLLWRETEQAYVAEAGMGVTESEFAQIRRIRFRRGDAQLEAYAVAPIASSRDNPLGILAAYRNDRAAFDGTDLEIFRGVAESPQQPYSTLHEARSAYEREFILRKLQEHRWNMTQTASALGLERSHLYRKMKSLGIAAPE